MRACDDYPYIDGGRAAVARWDDMCIEIDRLRSDSRDADVLEMENRNLRELLTGLGVAAATIDACAERVPH